MTTDRAHVHITVVVKCGFIGCDWSRPIGTAPLEVHQEYLDHLDVHDPDHIAAASEHDVEVARALAHDKIHAVHHEGSPQFGYTVDVNGGLYAGDTAEQIAADQARVDRFMAGGEDQ